MKPNKAIFLDRDGTINEDFGYVYKKDNLKFINGAIKALKILQDAGYKLLIITNQSGIGRGYYTIEDFQIFNDYMLNELEKNGVIIDKVYFCPHTDSDNCNCRKPKIGLYLKAIKEFNIDEENSYSIGDKESDLAICSKSKIKGIFLGNNNKYNCKNDLLEAAKYILSSKH